MVVARGGALADEGGPGSGPVVFVSYCREDAEWLRRFAVMLKPEVRGRGMQLWRDTLIGASRKWRPEIEEAIARADVALLLVSPDFLASDFIMGEELPALIERGVPLVPVLLRACRHAAVAELASVQWAHDPGRDGPVATASDVDGAIVRVTDRLMALLDEQTRSAYRVPEVSGPGDRLGTVSTSALIASSRVGALDGVPPAPLGFVARDELADFRLAVLAGREGAVAITGGGGLGLYGQGGIGKTVLAAALARDEELRCHFPDGVYWIALGERPDLLGAQLDLLGRLGVSAGDVRTTLDGVKALKDALVARRCLLVVDDVWSAAAAQAFDVTGSGGRVLFTTRDPTTLRDVRTDVHRVDVLSEGAAKQLLAGLTTTPVEALPPDVERVLAATGKVALALALIGAAVGRGGRDWRQVADDLEQAGKTFLAHPYANVFKAMQVAVAKLDPELAAAHEMLAVFPEDTRVPVTTVARYWAHAHGVPPGKACGWIAQLAVRELLSRENDRIVLHDLQRDFLLLRAPSLRLLHHELLEAYRVLLPSPRTPWRELPEDEPYIVEHLVEHLVGAGDTYGATTTVTDLGFIAIRAFRNGPHAAEGDARRAAALAPANPAIAWVIGLLTQWGHVLVGHDRLSDLAATLLTRATTLPPGIDADTLRSLLPTRALQHCWGLPDAHHALRRVLEGHNVWVNGIAFSPDGATLASAGNDGPVRLWDVAGASQTALLESHSGRVRAVAFSPDGATLASAGHDGLVRLWDVAERTQTALLNGHSDWVLSVAFSPDGRRLASAGADGTVRLWDVTNASQIALLEGHSGWVRAVAYSPDGATLASAGHDGLVRLWDLASATQTTQLEGHDGWIYRVAFSPDGATLASAGDDTTVRLWDIPSASQTALLEGHGGRVRAAAFSPDGVTLASAGADGTVRLWDLVAMTQIALLEGHSGEVNTIAFSPDGATLANAGHDGSLRLWDLADATQTALHQVHSDGVRAVAFSRDGALLASAGARGSLRLWDLANATQTARFEGHSSWVYGVAFSPDGATLASAGRDGSVRLWDIAGVPRPPSRRCLTAPDGEATAQINLPSPTEAAEAPDFEAMVEQMGGRLLRPDRKDEPRRFGQLGAVRQWIESIIDTLKGQLSLERHGARTMPGLMARISIRLLALAAAIRHNQLAGSWNRSLIHYDH